MYYISHVKVWNTPTIFSKWISNTLIVSNFYLGTLNMTLSFIAPKILVSRSDSCPPLGQSTVWFCLVYSYVVQKVYEMFSNWVSFNYQHGSMKIIIEPMLIWRFLGVVTVALGCLAIFGAMIMTWNWLISYLEENLFGPTSVNENISSENFKASLEQDVTNKMTLLCET